MPQKNRKKAASFQPKSNSQPKPLLNRPHTMLAQVASKNGTYTDRPSTISETIVAREKETVTSNSLTSVITASNSDFRFTTKNASVSEKSEASQNSAEQWKMVVQRYIRIFNEAETEQHPYLLLEHVRDEEHQARISKRLERIRERELMRGAWPKLSETKGELVRVYDAGDEVAVMLKLHIKRKIEQGSVMYTDERYEYERLWLKHEADSWVIKRVEPIIYERRPKYGDQSWMPQTSDNEQKHGGVSGPSIPYLNNEMLTAFMPSMFRAFHYRRDLAAAYADRWWNEGNPAYELFEVNCTNYVSQCLFAGTAPMNYTGKRASGWWYNGRDKGQELWSYSWAVSQALTNYLSAHRQSGLRAESVATADQLELGDVITYDWAGDGRFQHSTIVTAFDAFGRPLVNANTVPSRHRYWDYSDSYAWTPNTKYRFFHIISD